MSGCACIECVQQSDAAVVEKWGGFSHTLGPGMNCVLWPMYQVAGTLSLKVQQLEVRCETKTLDNVFIEVIVAIQYNVLRRRSATRSTSSRTRGARSRPTSTTSCGPRYRGIP